MHPSEDPAQSKINEIKNFKYFLETADMKCAFSSLSCLCWHSADVVFIQLITLNALNSNDLHRKEAEAV